MAQPYTEKQWEKQMIEDSILIKCVMGDPGSGGIYWPPGSWPPVVYTGDFI